MRYVWDGLKQRTNVKKHGVEFADAAVALEDEDALTVSDDESESEYRFKTLCASPLPHVLMVVHTEEIDGLITIVGARRAEPSERQQYLGGIYYGY